jgi:carbonic anhydrase
MRHLIVLTACCLVTLAASAAPEKAAAADGAASAASAKPSIVPKLGPAKRPAKEGAASERAPAAEPADEADLSAKIAARIEEMRAQQAARIAAANQARRAAEARKKAAAAAAAVPPPRPVSHHWSYEGEIGPAMWGKINPEWTTCGTGKRQSPIDIRDGMKVDLEPIEFDYRPATFSVVDNGHTIQVNLGGGNYISVGGRSFELQQFHFHRPSEERINGRGFEMVVHLVHKSPEGRLAVIAVLLERGAANSLIQTVWNHLPLEKHDVVSPSVVLDMNGILPARREYYTYMGSLTTPPCTEGVLWMVLKQPVSSSPAQMALFSRLYPMNARPIQSSSGRVIKESH